MQLRFSFNVLFSAFAVLLASNLYSAPVDSSLGADGSEFANNENPPMAYIEATDKYCPYLFDETCYSLRLCHVEIEFSVAEPFQRWCFVNTTGYREIINNNGQINIGGVLDYPESGRHYLLFDDRRDSSFCCLDDIYPSCGGYWSKSPNQDNRRVGIFGLFQDNDISHINITPKRLYWMKWWSPEGELIYDIIPTEEGLFDKLSERVLPYWGPYNSFVYGIEEEGLDN